MHSCYCTRYKGYIFCRWCCVDMPPRPALPFIVRYQRGDRRNMHGKGWNQATQHVHKHSNQHHVLTLRCELPPN